MECKFNAQTLSISKVMEPLSVIFEYDLSRISFSEDCQKIGQRGLFFFEGDPIFVGSMQ